MSIGESIFSQKAFSTTLTCCRVVVSPVLKEGFPPQATGDSVALARHERHPKGHEPRYIFLSGTSHDYDPNDLVVLPVFCYFSFSPASFQIPVGLHLEVMINSSM